MTVDSRPLGNWRSWGHAAWSDLPLYANGDPAAYSSAEGVARMFPEDPPVWAGPFIFYADGAHVVADGWTRQEDGRYLQTDQAATGRQREEIYRTFLPRLRAKVAVAVTLTEQPTNWRVNDV